MSACDRFCTLPNVVLEFDPAHDRHAVSGLESSCGHRDIRIISTHQGHKQGARREADLGDGALLEVGRYVDLIDRHGSSPQEGDVPELPNLNLAGNQCRHHIGHCHHRNVQGIESRSV
jgi:hypothetical protein